MTSPSEMNPTTWLRSSITGMLLTSFSASMRTTSEIVQSCVQVNGSSIMMLETGVPSSSSGMRSDRISDIAYASFVFSAVFLVRTLNMAQIRETRPIAAHTL